jgi:two-component system, NarL family, invasion response regulator UvrY
LFRNRQGVEENQHGPDSLATGDGPMIRVVVADRHPVVRIGLRAILVRRCHITTLGEAETGPELLHLVAKQPWDVVVLDASLPDRNGLEIVKEIKRTQPKLPVLVLSDHPENELAVRALRAGAAGYISKTATPAELVNAVLRLAQGQRYMSPAAAEELITALGSGYPSDQAPHERLSNREFQVLCLLGSGKSVGRIAEELERSVKTISTYRARILTKMEMHSTAELVHYALQRRLTEPA